MSVELIKEIAQILFWCGGLILAFLTYINARKTLLSPVNTEYQKRVFDSLNQIGEKLFSELKMGSEQHWIRQRPMQAALKEINAEYQQNKQSIQEFGLEITDYPTAKDWHSFQCLADEARYELFLPEALREKLIRYLEERAEAAEQATAFAIKAFVDDINRRKSYEEISEENFIDIENYYLDKMGKLGMSIEQIHEKNDLIMKEIVHYVQSFNPIKK